MTKEEAYDLAYAQVALSVGDVSSALRARGEPLEVHDLLSRALRSLAVRQDVAWARLAKMSHEGG